VFLLAQILILYALIRNRFCFRHLFPAFGADRTALRIKGFQAGAAGLCGILSTADLCIRDIQSGSCRIFPVGIKQLCSVGTDAVTHAAGIRHFINRQHDAFHPQILISLCFLRNILIADPFRTRHHELLLIAVLLGIHAQFQIIRRAFQHLKRRRFMACWMLWIVQFENIILLQIQRIRKIGINRCAIIQINDMHALRRNDQAVLVLQLHGIPAAFQRNLCAWLQYSTVLCGGSVKLFQRRTAVCADPDILLEIGSTQRDRMRIRIDAAHPGMMNNAVPAGGIPACMQSQNVGCIHGGSC